MCGCIYRLKKSSEGQSVAQLRPWLVQLYVRYTRMANHISRVFCVRQALPKQSNSPVICEKRCLDRYVVVQMSGLGLKVTDQLDIWYLYKTIVSLG